MQKGFNGESIDKELVKSVYRNQQDIIRVIMRLYCEEGIELDPTYSVGNFYSSLPKPKHRFDLYPQAEGVLQADCRNIPLPSESVASIMFDPPFVAGQGKEDTGIIRGRFGSYKNVEELWAMYRDALQEFYRLLKPNGILVFKCQDTISGGRQYLSHVDIINSAINRGFYPLDLFILLADNRIVQDRGEQQHARKFHSYFIVFQKKKSAVKYEPSLAVPQTYEVSRSIGAMPIKAKEMLVTA